MLLSVSHVSASGINLICTEKGGSVKEKEKSGESENVLTDLWSIPVSVDITSNRATLWGASKDLTIEPTQLTIQELSRENSEHRNTTIIQVLKVDRKTLGFTYGRGSTISSFLPLLGLWTMTSSTRKSHGICTKVKEQKGNKI
jgi:hypothetical protein